MKKKLSPEQIAKRKRFNKRMLLFFFLPLIIGVVIIASLPGSQEACVDQHDYIKEKIKFDQIGYFKGESEFGSDKFRLFTFYVSDTNWYAIKTHGDKLMHTKGSPTVAFYYTDRNLIKDITSVKNFTEALRHGYVPGCVAKYWKNPKGKVVFEKFPIEDF